jgi:hypothetical protein
LADIFDQIKAAIASTELAKSRRTNAMSAKEQAALVAKLEDIIQPLLAPEPAPSANGNGNSGTEQWIGTSEADDLEIMADKKSDILDAWMEEFSIDRDKVLSTKVGYAYFYVYPNPDGITHELWVKKQAA